jgi:hypothetical protein
MLEKEKRNGFIILLCVVLLLIFLIVNQIDPFLKDVNTSNKEPPKPYVSGVGQDEI